MKIYKVRKPLFLTLIIIFLFLFLKPSEAQGYLCWRKVSGGCGSQTSGQASVTYQCFSTTQPCGPSDECSPAGEYLTVMENCSGGGGGGGGGGNCTPGAWEYCEYNGQPACRRCMDNSSWGVCATQDYPAHCQGPTATPRPTNTPTPTPETGTGDTPTPTPTSAPTVTIDPNCACQSDNTCSSACPVYTASNRFSDVTYGVNGDNTKISCAREAALNGPTPPTVDDKRGYCGNPLRLKGDANGDGLVNEDDYLYYLRSVLGAPIPPSVNPDFNGDGLVSAADLAIFKHAR